jgi:hypothetical protein
MGKRLPNPRLAKKHRNYSVGDIAALFKVHKNTVRAWCAAGLTPINDHRKPLLFLGAALTAFLEARRAKNKRPLRPGQIYCVACRDAKEPALGMVDYVPLTPALGNLRGICPACERFIHRRVSRANLKAMAGQLEVTVTDAPPRITDTNEPSVNSDFKPMEKR